MPLERPHDPASPKNMLHIPAPLIGAVLALSAVLLLTYLGFSDSFKWLGLLAVLPLVVYLCTRPAVFLILVLVTTAGKIWLPMLPLNLPLDIFLRAGLLMLVVATGIIAKDNRRKLEGYRLAAYAFCGLVLVTMLFRGAGLSQLGGKLWGGKTYVVILINMAFMLLIPGAIRLTRRQWTWCLVLMTMAPLATIMADLVFALSGGRLYQLYYLFRPGNDIGATASELGQQDAGLWRLQSLNYLKLSTLGMLLAPWYSRKAWGWPFFAFCVLAQVVMTALSGFRGSLAMIPVYVLVFLLAYLPGRRTRVLVITGMIGLAGLLAVYSAGSRLPLPVQRAISWLPGLQLDARASEDALGSSNWRLDMWRLVIDRELPDYWLFGKGLAFNPGRMVDQVTYYPDYWVTIQNYITGSSYHNANLSLLVGFGIWGWLIMVALLGAAWLRCLRNFRREWGDPTLRHFFLVLMILYGLGVLNYFLIYGDLDFTLQNLLTLITLMELLVRSDDKLSAPAEAPLPPRLVDHPGRNHSGPRLIRHV